MHHRPIVKKLLVGLVLSATALMAGPITTVPWNGYTGAASITYDDGRPSQLSDLMPQVDKLGIKVTFFLANNMYSFPGKQSDWIKAAKNGHELANHSGNHNSPTAANIADMAKVLRGLDPTVDAVTYAYPNCTVNANDASGENFMARGCASAQYGWNGSEPNWMNIQALIVETKSNGSNLKAATDNINAAKSGNSWTVILMHDVTSSSSDIYYLTPTENLAMLNAAVNAKVWVAPFGTVGAYYRAHFTMDKVTASGAGPWNLTWTSPHAKMPKSVKLKVKLDAATFGSSFTVSQDNVTIPANTDGSYTIDFMKLKLAVTKGSSGVSRASGLALGGVSLRRTASEIVMTGIGSTGFDMTVRNLNGRILASKHVEARSDAGTEKLALDPTLAGSPVLAVISATDGSALRSIPLAPVR
ncbi:MAG: polysaccharide deacetylase family protein [Fibrobacterota bacterium]